MAEERLRPAPKWELIKKQQEKVGGRPMKGNQVRLGVVIDRQVGLRLSGHVPFPEENQTLHNPAKLIIYENSGSGWEVQEALIFEFAGNYDVVNLSSQSVVKEISIEMSFYERERSRHLEFRIGRKDQDVKKASEIGAVFPPEV
jgi:hypothetical protein